MSKNVSFEIRGREIYILVNGKALNMPWSPDRVDPEIAMAPDFEEEIASSMRAVLHQYVRCSLEESEAAAEEFKALLPKLMH